MKQYRSFFLILLTGISFAQCKIKRERHLKKISCSIPANWTENTAGDIHHTLEYLQTHQGNLNDSVELHFTALMDSLYDANQYKPIWIRGGKDHTEGHSFLNLMQNSRSMGTYSLMIITTTCCLLSTALFPWIPMPHGMLLYGPERTSC